MNLDSTRSQRKKMSQEAGDDYSSSLGDLTMNSKPLINMLTILAEENLEHAAVIVQSVEKHLDQVRPEIKLPVLYLVDSIIKNVGGAYTQLFSQIIVAMFCKVFKQVDERTRSQMFKLRETWHDVFPSTKLYQLDVKVNIMDPAWPIQARPSPSSSNIHVNPNFLQRTSTTSPEEDTMRAAVARKEQELLQLQRKKIEMELEQTRKQLLEQRKALDRTTTTNQVAPRPRPVPVSNNNSSTPRIAPANPAMVSSARRRDPRLTRPPAPPPAPAPAPSPPKLPRHHKSRVDKLPPIPRMPKTEAPATLPSPTPKRKKESVRSKHKKPKEESPKEKPRSKERYPRRPREAPAQPAPPAAPPAPEVATVLPVAVAVANGVGDVDLRTLPVPVLLADLPPLTSLTPLVPLAPLTPAVLEAPVEVVKTQRKRTSSPPELNHEPPKKTKSEKLDALFGAEDVDLRTLPPEEVVKETVKEAVTVPAPDLAAVRAKLAEATRKDPLGRPLLFTDETNERRKSRNSEDTDMRPKPTVELDGNSLDGNIKIIMSQAEEQLKTGDINKQQYNVLLMQVLQLNERQKLKEAKQKESLEASKRKLNKELQHGHASPRSDSADSLRSPSPPLHMYGDIDERVPSHPDGKRAPLLPCPPSMPDYEMRKQGPSHGRPPLHARGWRGGWRGSRPEWRGNYRGNNPWRGPPSANGGPIQGGPMQGGPMQGGPMQGGPMQGGPMQGGPMQGGPMQGGPMQGGPMQGGPMQGGSMQGGPMQGGPMQGGPMQGGPMQGGPMQGGPMQGGPMQGGPMQGGPMQGGPMQGGPMLGGPMQGDPMQGGMMPGGPMLVGPMSGPIPVVGPLLGVHMGPSPLDPYVNEGRASPPWLGTPVHKEGLPPISPEVFDYIARDTMKTIAIDGVAREIRYYGTTAVVMLDWEDPRDISFQPGQRRLSLDDESFTLLFNQDYSSVTVDGQPHRIRLGAPTRELFIDDAWFECFFGGPAVPILLNGKVRALKLEGPAPQVNIGTERRTDLVAGKIKLIIDATTMVPVFLDAKPQTFFIEGVPHSLRFVDALRTILINETPFKVEFGGLPKPIYVHKRKHFIRFSVLPSGVKVGEVYIANMEGFQPAPPPPKPKEEPAPIEPKLEPHNSGVSSARLDMLASIVPSHVAPLSGLGGYSMGTPDLRVPPPINVGDLFAKLVASGILGGGAQTAAPASAPQPPPTKPPNLQQPETLRVRQSGLVSALHSGMQCGSCGARFPPEHTVRYSQHLDWHFRQNRADRDSQRRPHSRPWYYDISDWVQFEEIEDLEEREKSWFERQMEESEAVGTGVGGAEEVTEGEEVGVAAPPPSAPPHQLRCPHCGDPFHQYYNQEVEEWQLRRAVPYKGDNYHPLCLQEFKAGEEKPKEEIPEKDEKQQEDELKEEQEPEEPEPEEEATVEEEEEDEVQLVEEDDDVVIKAEPVVQIVVEDDVETDEETEKERAARDADPLFADFKTMKIKQEPIDPDDEPIITSVEETVTTLADTTHAAVVSSIDGNVQLPTVHTAPTAPKIRINITSTPAVQRTATPPAAPPPPAEEEELPPPAPHEAVLKPDLQGVDLEVLPPSDRGRELSALCSIM